MWQKFKHRLLSSFSLLAVVWVVVFTGFSGNHSQPQKQASLISNINPAVVGIEQGVLESSSGKRIPRDVTGRHINIYH